MTAPRSAPRPTGRRRIDSLPQSWAWLSGAADPARADQALESAWQHLVRQDEGLVLLFEPPFDQSKPSPGYIKGYPPGVRENGGQYTHAALWMAMAMARKGDGERAVQLLRMLNPIEHARDAEAVWHYGVEPYVVAADVYRLPGRIGQGGWSWYTGSAAWMYRAWVEEVLGLQIRGEQMQINPVIPATWPGFSLRYRHGETIYSVPGGESGRLRAWCRLGGDGWPANDGWRHSPGTRTGASIRSWSGWGNTQEQVNHFVAWSHGDKGEWSRWCGVEECRRCLLPGVLRNVGAGAEKDDPAHCGRFLADMAAYRAAIPLFRKGN